MGYQALLFCPDEKTARSVTQVLSELDFTVIPCTEPFGAVKKLMAEHFDAVVVDCDNEQNATLLFKSARNTPNNQSALAVAVVEGQAGVAKAFRIGANLVLTKPINVEQAKGTLRVARGLLRKNEAGKPAASTAAPTAAPAATVKPAKPAPVAPKPVTPTPNTRVVTARPVPPVKPLVKAATASIPTEKPVLPKVAASIPPEIPDSDGEILDVGDEVAAPSISAPEVKMAASHSANVPPSRGFSPANSAGYASGAASAPAPARESKPEIAAEHKSSAVIPETPVGKVADLSAHASSSEGTSAPPSAFTFGGNVEKASGGRTKKTLIAVVAILLVAAAGYAVWMQWIRSSGAAVPFTQVAAPVKTPAAAPQAAHSPAPVAAAPATSSPTPAQSSTPDATAVPTSNGAAKASSDSDAPDTDSEEDAPAHPAKAGAKGDSAKATAPGKTAAPTKTPTEKPAAPAIVLKNNASQTAAKPAPQVADAQAPSITGIAPADNGGSISSLMAGQSNAPTPILQTLTVSQGVSQGLLVKKPQPVYPASAMRMRIEGTVELLATVSKAGDISAVKILTGDPTLARAASDAVKQWKYKPYLLNGDPVEIQTQITINFKLPR
jgi:periplasmic protein TonB